jgi:RNA-binding protein
MDQRAISGILNPQDLRGLKSQLHRIKPAIVIPTKKLSDQVFHDIDRALEVDELVKIRTCASSSKELLAIADKICTKAEAVLIQTVGYIIAIYRKNLVVEE